jgi:hypothetical protein
MVPEVVEARVYTGRLEKLANARTVMIHLDLRFRRESTFDF